MFEPLPGADPTRVDAIIHLIAYVGFPGGLTALDIANEVIGSRK
jgi:hypothetical protein